MSARSDAGNFGTVAARLASSLLAAWSAEYAGAGAVAGAGAGAGDGAGADAGAGSPVFVGVEVVLTPTFFFFFFFLGASVRDGSKDTCFTGVFLTVAGVSPSS